MAAYTEVIIMKKRNFLIKGIAIASLGSMLMAGCGSSSSYDSYAANSEMTEAKAYDDYAYGDGGEYYAVEEMADYDYGYDNSGSTAATPSVIDTSRKLITTANLSVETKEFDTMIDDIETYVKDNGGYIESINLYNGSRYNGNVIERHASITVRIPAEKLDGFLTEIGNAGNIIDRSQSVEDITLSYVDMQAHKDTLKGEEKRLIELLENADAIEDMITIEDRLADIRYQIESMESQLRTFDNKVNYSTIYMNVDEVVDYTPVVYEEPSLGDRMKEGFFDTIDDIKEWCEDFAVWFVSNIIYLVIWAIIIFAIVKWILYMASDKRAAKKAENLAKKQKAQYEAYQNTMNAGAQVQPQAPVQNAQPQAAAQNAQPQAPVQPAQQTENKTEEKK